MHQSLKKCKFIFRVRTESWILEKVLKFAQQFSRPGKSLVNGDKEKFIFVFVPKFESWEKLCSCFSWGLYWSPILITLSLEKKTVVLGKKSWFLDQKTSSQTLILKVTFWLLSPLSMLKFPLMAERECAPLIRSRFHIQMCLLINYIILEWGRFWKLIISKLLSIT